MVRGKLWCMFRWRVQGGACSEGFSSRGSGDWELTLRLVIRTWDMGAWELFVCW